MIEDNAIVRFWSKIDISGSDECWLWKGGIRPNGYGQIKISKETRSAHRVSYELTHGTRPPKGFVVMHTCDVKRCVNPKHLVLGTTFDNVRDRDRKGRQARGEVHYKAKLTEADIDLIRTERAKGVSRIVLAERYGISLTGISRATNGQCWKHIINPHPIRPTIGSGNPGAKLTENLIPLIRDRAREGLSCPAIAREFGVAREAIRRIISNKTWRHVN